MKSRSSSKYFDTLMKLLLREGNGPFRLPHEMPEDEAELGVYVGLWNKKPTA